MTTFSGIVSIGFGVLLPEIRKDFEVTFLAAGVLTTSFSLFNTVMGVPIATFFSRFNPVRLVTIAGALGAVCLFLQSLTWSFASLFAARMAFTMLQAIKNPARSLLMQQWLPVRSIGVANRVWWSIHGITQTVGIGIAAVVVGLIGEWRVVYVAMSLVMAVQVVVWTAVARQRRTASFEERFHAQRRTPMAALLKYPRFWAMSAALFGGCVPWSALLLFLPTFLRENNGMGASLAGASAAVMYAGLTASSFVVAVLERRMVDRRILISGSAVLLLVSPLVVLHASNPALVLGAAFTNGLGWMMMPIMQTMPFQIPDAKPREIAVIAAQIQAGTGLGMGLGPLIVGMIHQATGSIYSALLIASLFPALTIAAGLVAPRRVHAARQALPEAV